MLDFVPADLPTEPQRLMFDYWRRQKGDLAMPPVTALDPTCLPIQSLHMMKILEPVSPDDFLVRLAGTGIRDAVGFEFTGLRLRDVDGAENSLERLLWCRRTARPYFARCPVNWASTMHRAYSVLVLPFGPGTEVMRLVPVFDFEYDTA